MLYNNQSSQDKDKNFPDFSQSGAQDLMNMMGNLDINSNNDNIFNQNSNDDNQHSLSQAFNQISQGNFNPFDSFHNSLVNESQFNKPKNGKNQSKKNFNQNNNNNILGNTGLMSVV